ncbi:MAG: class II fructose-bisphosphate aldolase [Crocinitomicaceae bacterium]|nr:class II fructose-bisphosphate aldolase [Crocinitomicaceae bacterium]
MLNKLLHQTDLLAAHSKSLLAFNIQNIHQIRALHQSCVQLETKAIAQFSSSLINYIEDTYAFVRLKEKFGDRLFFHLDHCTKMEVIERCIGFGFDSVMYDGAHLPLMDNIKYSNIIYEKAHNRDICLEVELGAISGVEDGFGSEDGHYFSMDELSIFFNEAKFDFIALGIGNAHGFYKSSEGIKVSLLKDAQRQFPQMRHVLHGGTGMSSELINEAIQYGTVKINFSTELKAKTVEVLTLYSASNPLFNEVEFSDYHNKILIPYFEELLITYTCF